MHGTRDWFISKREAQLPSVASSYSRQPLGGGLNILLTVKVKTHVSSYFPNRPHIHLQTDPTKQLPPDSDGIWTKSTSCLLYLRCVIPPQKQMSGKSSVWSDQVLFSCFYFRIYFFIIVNLLARAQILPWMMYSALLIQLYAHVQLTGQTRSKASGVYFAGA